MKTVWNRIHAWLDANAPVGYGHLRPGTSTDAIRAAEKRFGLKLPKDFKASYRIHDGQANEPGLIGGEGWCLLTLQNIVARWQKWYEHDPRFRYRVPVAWGGAGDSIFLDLTPEAEMPNRIMVQRSDSDEPDLVSPSFRTWLEDFADKLENDELAYSEADGCLMYSDEMDLD